MIGRVVAATLVIVLAVARPAAAATVTGYDYFAANSLADGVLTELEVQNLLPINELLGIATNSAEAHLGTSTDSALAVLPNPGNVALSAPGLVASLANLANLPEYPAQASASYPASPSAHIAIPTGTLSATTTANSATAVANAAALQAVVVSIGAVNATASAKALSPTHYVATATETIHDIDVLSGVLHIGAISSSATATIDGAHATATTGTTTVAGVTLAGQPIAITQAGLQSPGGSTALAPIIASLAAPLAAEGITVRLTPGQTTQSGTQASAVSSALSIDLKSNVEGYPAHTALLLGQTQVSVSASSPTFAPSSSGTPPAAAGGGAPAPSVPLFLPPPVAAPTLPPVVTPGPTSAPLTPLPIPTSPAGPNTNAAFVAGLRGLDFRPVYPWMALGALALLVAPRMVRRWRRRPAPSDLRQLWRW